MIPNQRSSLASYASGLLSAGRATFVRPEAEQALGIARGPFLDAAERLQKRGHLISPRQGFYVVVPPQHASWGAPPPQWYIDELMRHENEPYYVGLLKAAELHGAAHQAVMEFQIICGKRLSNVRAGRSLIAFYYRKEMAAVTAGIEERKTDSGTMKVSSVELTAFDLLRYPQASGGIDNVATILKDLGADIDGEKLAALSEATERPVVQRLGYLLDRLGYSDRSAPMLRALHRQGPVSWTELDRGEAYDPDFRSEPLERDPRWKIIVRRLPEIDE
jgi:predicted transcriptional regulator of viral defense system